MNVLADTSVWSEALRRRDGRGQEGVVDALKGLIEKGTVFLIGPIRQELLSGIRDPGTFDAVRDQLRNFTDVPVLTEDYEKAADLYNRCRGKGIQGSRVDLLICAVSLNRNSAIFTLDEDFGHYANAIPIRLFKWF